MSVALGVLQLAPHLLGVGEVDVAHWQSDLGVGVVVGDDRDDEDDDNDNSDIYSLCGHSYSAEFRVKVTRSCPSLSASCPSSV